MRTIIRLLAAVAFLASVIPAPRAQADGGDTSQRTTKKKVADQSRKVDKFIDANNNGVDDRKERSAVKSSAAESSGQYFVAPKSDASKSEPAPSAKDESSKPAAAPEKPKEAPKPPKPKTDKSKVEKQPVKKPD